MLKVAVIILFISAASAALALASMSALAQRPADLGARDGRLAACRPSPNCVGSQDADAAHAVEPLRFTGDADDTWRRLQGVLASMPRTKVIRDEDGYLHAECTSLVFRFVDDLECLLDRGAKVIHVRSASRVGWGDLGVNRRRVEAIRAAFDQSGRE